MKDTRSAYDANAALATRANIRAQSQEWPDHCNTWTQPSRIQRKPARNIKTKTLAGVTFRALFALGLIK